MSEGDAGSGSGSGGGSRARIAVPAAVAVVAALVLVVWAWLALPGLIAERTLGLMLGVACDPVDIEVTPNLSQATIGRTECTVPYGPIASFTLSNGADVALRNLRPTVIDVPMLAVNPRALEVAATAAAVLITGDTPDPLRRILVALASVARRTDLPERVSVGEIDLGRGEHVLETHGLVLTHGTGTFDVALPSLGPPAYHGRMIDWTLGINDIAIHATESSAVVTGHFDVEASVLSFPLSRTIAFRLTGSHLDGDAADYDLWLEPSAEVTWLQAHGQALLDEIRAAGGVHEAIEQRREERATDRESAVHELRERLDRRLEEQEQEPTP